MRNIRKFETFEDFLASQAAVSGTGEYVEDINPGFVYIKDRYMAGGDGYIVFNKSEGSSSGESGDTGYIFGDIIYHDGGNELKSVFCSGWTDTLGTPVGLIVIPSSMAPDGNARMIALTDIEEIPRAVSPQAQTTDGEQKSENLKSSDPQNARTFPFNGGNLNGGLNWYDVYALNYYDGEKMVYDVYGAGNPGAMSTDVSGLTENPVADGEYYTSQSNAPVVSPYMKESDEINPYYLQEAWEAPEPGQNSVNTSYNYNALSDLSGLTWTTLLADGGEVAYAAVQEFATSGTNAGDWYVPSLGEAGFIQARFSAIANIFHETFSESQYNAYLTLFVSYFTSTLAHNDNFSISSPVPFLYYSEQLVQDNSGTAKSMSPAKETTKSETTFGTSYPDFPFGRLDNIDIGLTCYQDSGPKSGSETKSGESVRSATNYANVRPMAMIKDGQIVTTAGIPVANGHQVGDLNSGGDVIK